MKLALTVPGPSGGYTIPHPSGLKNPLGEPFTDLASFVFPLLTVVYYIAVFMAFIWLVWGAFAYIMAQGNKENLAKARARITFALIGLVFILLAYFIAQFAAQIFPPTTGRGEVPF